MRYMRPSIAVFCVALLASLSVHLPIYEALGVLADALAEAADAARRHPVEFELAPLDDDATAEADQGEAAAPPRQDELADLPQIPNEPEVERQRPLVAPAPTPRPEEPDEKVTQLELVQPEPQPAPPPIHQEKLAVTQKSDDPDVAPPEDSQYIAEENRRVTEETVASLRNMHKDEMPDPGSASQPTEDNPGNADETEVADLQKVEGEDDRPPDLREANERPKEASAPSAGQHTAPAVTRAPNQGASDPSREVAPTVAAGSQETGGEPEEIVVNDGSGSFVIRRAPVGKGAADQGGAERPGSPSPHRGSREGARARSGSNLRLSWAQFEQTFGAEELRKQRQAYLEQRKSRARGGSRQRAWRKFRAAIENFVPNVRPGNQTALNAAASPFAHYLATIHRRIHREFAHGFLRSLPIAGGPFSDRSLHTKLEIVINGDGSLHKVGVAKTSGFLPFDFGAFNSVMRASPYPAPPRRILSGDGRVYVHWGFYRNERQCGTFNASPFILPNPPGSPDPSPGPLRDPGIAPPAGTGQQMGARPAGDGALSARR